MMTQKEKLLAQYSNYLQMRNYSIDTYKSYMCSVRKFWEYCEQQRENPNFDKERQCCTELFSVSTYRSKAQFFYCKWGLFGLAMVLQVYLGKSVGC